MIDLSVIVSRLKRETRLFTANVDGDKLLLCPKKPPKNAMGGLQKY